MCVGGGGVVFCHSKPLSTPSGCLEAGWDRREVGRNAWMEGGQKKKPLGPLEKSGQGSKNTLRAEKPSGPGVNIQWVAAPERSDSQQRP